MKRVKGWVDNQTGDTVWTTDLGIGCCISMKEYHLNMEKRKRISPIICPNYRTCTLKEAYDLEE